MPELKPRSSELKTPELKPTTAELSELIHRTSELTPKISRMKPSTTNFNVLRTKHLKAKAQIRTEARDLAKAHDLSGLKPRTPELKPGSLFVALGPSWASLGPLLKPLGPLLAVSFRLLR